MSERYSSPGEAEASLALALYLRPAEPPWHTPSFCFPSLLVHGGTATGYRQNPNGDLDPWRYNISGARMQARHYIQQNPDERIVNCIVRVYLKRN